MDVENIHPQLRAAMSPMSALSQSLQGMKTRPALVNPFAIEPSISAPLNFTNITTSPPPSAVCRFQRTQGANSTRRRLSLSLDSMMSPPPATPAQSSSSRCSPSKLSFSSLITSSDTPSTNVSPPSVSTDFSRRSSLSPYKTPGKKSSDDGKEDEQTVFGDDDDDDDIEVPASPSAKHTAIQDIKRSQRRSDSLTGLPMRLQSLPPLRRSSSDMNCMPKRRLPRPWASTSMSSSAETPQEWIKRSKTDLTLEQRNLCLPTLASGSHPDLNCIAPATVVDLMQGKYSEHYSQYFIIDCRFPYEYDGGHIRGALNLTENEIKTTFIDTPIDSKVCIIFHCEFSSKRAPSCYKFLRGLDRKANVQDYPKLYYNDVYLLDGGYKRFYEERADFCDGGYVLMRDEQYLGEMKDHIRQRAGVKRSRSFSFSHLSSTSILSSQPITISSVAPALSR